MLLAVLSGFLLAVLTPLLHRLSGHALGWVLALLPASLAIYFGSLVPLVSDGGSLVVEYPWLPGLDITLDFLVDGLSLVFALLISVIGTFVLIYAGAYLRGHPYLGRFFVIILAFMASMLGLVLSDNLLTLFVFWELTSITSYLLIGFDHDRADARKSALQGLFVTTAGSLALMAGLILLAMMTGSYSLSDILASSDPLHEHALYAGMVVCILAGALTKSAQVPFHFWLPNAMAAPTPVSAYLHSATMVKAGIYLMARLNPALGEGALWGTLLMGFGAATMIVGAWFAFTSTGIKKVLAYSTVMTLGTLTMLIGVGTELALTAFIGVLVAHSLYKGALFMVAGIVDHATGTKDLRELGGLRRRMPATTAFALLAAMSMAGLPPLFGFIAKELTLEAVLTTPLWSAFLTLAVVLAFMLVVGVAALVSVKPFFGAVTATPRTPHEAPIAMLAGPVALSLAALAFGLAPHLPETAILQAAMGAVAGAPVDSYLALWHGINVPLVLSVVSLVTGVVLYRLWPRIQPDLNAINTAAARYGPEATYFRFMEGISALASWQTRRLQNGVLGHYLLVLVAVTFGLTGLTLVLRHEISLGFNLSGSRFYEWGIAALLVASAVFASRTRSRLGSVASLGVLGFSVALVFILFSAPDLGITQLLVETLTVVLLVLVLFRLPEFVSLSSRFERFRDLTIAILAGVVVTLLMLAGLETRYFESISAYYSENAAPLAQGRNIVNVILVDFRALDTLGEIFVLALAAIGIHSMLKLKAEDQHRP
ncbi:putative monovalent cation/H+ antiporter subunit A [Marinobacter lacisalsi]|uniref:Monovalent cation/H+ antiporter subunit A n=1 Tax=Marinobacter lacisalsi TaxID=475979 RepID=A0ABV8QJY3_9GAMM